jgi:hypothetical protein
MDKAIILEVVKLENVDIGQPVPFTLPWRFELKLKLILSWFGRLCRSLTHCVVLLLECDD